MKYKKYLLSAICILLIGSYIGFNIIKNKSINKKKPDTASIVPANSNYEQKTTDNYQDSGINRNNSSDTLSENKASKIDITMIDKTPNVAGNTSGNIANEGFAAQQGKWMYYTLPNMRNSRPMYRSMMDGETGLKPLMSSYTLRFINVIGDWIYYYNNSVNAIKKVKTDGTEDNKVLNDVSAAGMIVINDWIYYSTEGSLLGIFKIKTDGTEKKQITNDSTMFPFSIEGNTLFYSYTPSQNDNNTGLYKIDLDGSNRVKLISDNCKNVVAQGDWIYYINFSDNSSLYKIKKDGTQRKKLLDLSLSCFNISGDAIYYVTYDDTSNLYKLNLQDNKLFKLTNNISNLDASLTSDERFLISSLSIIDDSIFCYCYNFNNNPNGFLYRVKKDGTLDKIIN